MQLKKNITVFWITSFLCINYFWICFWQDYDYHGNSQEIEDQVYRNRVYEKEKIRQREDEIEERENQRQSNIEDEIQRNKENEIRKAQEKELNQKIDEENTKIDEENTRTQQEKQNERMQEEDKIMQGRIQQQIENNNQNTFQQNTINYENKVYYKDKTIDNKKQKDQNTYEESQGDDRYELSSDTQYEWEKNTQWSSNNDWLIIISVIWGIIFIYRTFLME